MTGKTFFSLREAAAQVGKDKMTISRAITKGRLSAVKQDNQWRIEPSELFRVFEPAPKPEEGRETGDKNLSRQSETTDKVRDLDRLRLELAMKTETLERLEQERSRERSQFQDRIDDLARRLDKADEDRTRLTAVLTDQRPAQRTDNANSNPQKPSSSRQTGWRRFFDVLKA